MNPSKTLLFLSFIFFSSLSVFAQDQDQSEYCSKKIISKIEFIGLEVTKEHVVTRELFNKKGQTLDCNYLELEKSKLMGLDIFSSVISSTKLEDEELILIYDFKELPAYLILPAIAKTDQEGWLASINFATLNLGGIDIRTQASWRTNFHPKLNTSNEYFAHFGSPWLGSLPIEYIFFIGKTQSFNSLKEFDEDSYRNEIGTYYRFHPNLSLKTYHAGYYTNHTSDTLTWHDQGDVDVILGYALGLRYDNLNSAINPTKGFYSEVEWMPHFLANESLKYQLFKMDFRTWQSIGHHIGHLSSLMRYRLGTTAFYEAYHIGGVNSLRGYTPDPDRYYQSEWLNTLEYRYQIVELSPFTLPVLDWNLFWGLESVVGWDLVYSWNPNEKGEFYHAPFIGIHLLQPGIQRIRFELGLKGFKTELSFAIGFFEKSTTQNWIGR